MANENKIPEHYLLLVETIIKLNAIERLLIKSKLISIDELQNEMKVISKEVIDIMSLQDGDSVKN